MSKKSRERRKNHKTLLRPDEYYGNGEIEIARFGKNTIIRNNMTTEQHSQYMSKLSAEYPDIFKRIADKIKNLRDKIIQADPIGILSYLWDNAMYKQINVHSEHAYTKDAIAIMRAQEYVQSVLVSTVNEFSSMTIEDQQKLWDQIVIDFEDIYIEFYNFYRYWAAHTEEQNLHDRDVIDHIVEAQMMYWVRGNRYPVFELEPIKCLLPPHDEKLQEIFGLTSEEIINGLQLLQYSLSQGFIDTKIDLIESYEKFCAAVDSGVDAEKAIQDNNEQIHPIIDKVFGAGLNDVSDITGWNEHFIDALSIEVGKNTSFFDDENDFSGWPIVELPIMKKPFIKIGGKAYAFLYNALFDNIYRIIQKNLCRTDKEYIIIWKDKQTIASEEMVKNIFLRLLPGAKAYTNNFYPKNKSLKQMNQNDIILVYGKYLFVIEVKAGSFPQTPPIIDFDAHVKAYKALAQEVDSQCSRTIDYISKNSPVNFYDSGKISKFSLENITAFEEIFTFAVTVDNFNEFAAKAEKLSFISFSKQTIVISYDDLLAYAQYFDSPIFFLHYLKQRKAAIDIEPFRMSDELDHLGMYIDNNLYAMEPSKYDGFKYVTLDGFREELDEYFSMLYMNPDKAKKPQQKIPKEILDIIKYIEKNDSLDKIKFAHFLLDMSSKSREDFVYYIQHALKRQKQLECMIPIYAFGDIKYCLFIKQPGITSINLDNQYEYVYSAVSRNVDIPLVWIRLEYSNNNELIDVLWNYCLFSDLPENKIDYMKNKGCENAKTWVAMYQKKHGEIGRNDECPCGSGKKYKFCCLQESQDNK